jgi:hypothetical protein
MALIDSDRFSDHPRDGSRATNVDDVMRRMVKEELLTFEGRPLFPSDAVTPSSTSSPTRRPTRATHGSVGPPSAAGREPARSAVPDVLSRAEAGDLGPKRAESSRIEWIPPTHLRAQRTRPRSTRRLRLRRARRGDPPRTPRPSSG